MDAELLLMWMSEIGSGDIRDLRQRTAWMARTADLNPKQYETGRWLRDMTSLGHAEVQWTEGRWAVTPATAVLLPACGGTAVLAGSRRVELVDRLDAQDLAIHVERPARQPDGPLALPRRVYLQADSLPELKRALAAVDVQYVGYAANRLAESLPPLELGRSAAPPPRGVDVEHLAMGSDLRFQTGPPPGDGLCRISIFGRPSYLYRSGDSWYHTDHAFGVLYELAARNVSVFRWRRERLGGNDEIGTMFVDQGAPLPPLQARTLVLCSGQPTQFGATAKTAIYRNVPKTIAERVARSVRQQLAMVD